MNLFSRSSTTRIPEPRDENNIDILHMFLWNAGAVVSAAVVYVIVLISIFYL